MTRAFVGLGANLGDPRRQVEQAVVELDALPQTRVRARSPLYRSAPIGYEAQPEFVNAVAELRTSLKPGELFAALIEIEERHGRKRSFANAPRTLDLDLLLYGDEVIEGERLTVPHPRMHERAFVLQPLLDIAPGISIPGHGPALSLLKAIERKIERLADE
jgi:2-amino-4-hydroxy-6-hydroxymethyldihydropteridine diphosphokinase